MKSLLVATLLLLGTACGGSAPPPEAPAAESPRGDVLLVANKADATLSVIDLGTGRAVATLPTGDGPHEIAVSEDGTRAVVTNYGQQVPGNSLTVIDLPALRVERTIDLGAFRRPHGVVFLPDDRRVAVTAETDQAVVLVDTETGEVLGSAPTAQEGSHMLVLAPDGGRAYTANIGSGSVTALDLDSRSAVRTVPVGGYSEAIALTPDGREVWVASRERNAVTVLDAATLDSLASVPAAGFPIRLTPTPDGRRMLVTNVEGNRLQVVDVATRAVLATIPFPEGATPVGTLVAPDGNTAYVADLDASRVMVVDLGERAVTGYLPVGNVPDGLGLSRALR